MKKCIVKDFKGWSNMIDDEMGSSLVGVYTATKASPIKTSSMNGNNDMDANMANTFC